MPVILMSKHNRGVLMSAKTGIFLQVYTRTRSVNFSMMNAKYRISIRIGSPHSIYEVYFPKPTYIQIHFPREIERISNKYMESSDTRSVFRILKRPKQAKQARKPRK
jgi:hypothetical protein